jgi:general secretion pathway protein L
MVMAELHSELQHLRPQAAEAETLLSGNTRMETEIGRMAALQKSRLSTLFVLEELSARIPATAWVEHLTIQADGVRLTGYADSASELVTLLEASPLFKNVSFLSAITRTREGKERFLIGMDFQRAVAESGKP